MPTRSHRASRRRAQPLRGRGRRFAAALGLALGLALGAGPRPAAAVTAGEIGAAAFDLAVLRPLNAAAVVLGSVFFVASAPLVAPFGDLDNSWEAFVYAPYEYTFVRPIGEF